MRLNPCELEIDLFCHGLRVPGTVSLEGARGVRRTRAGLGSGLELTIPTSCRRHSVPIGLAPNIEVSLIVNPDDAAFLAPRTPGFYAYET